MASVSDAINNYPDISFIDDLTLEDLQEQMIEDFTEKYEELTGTSVTLGEADPSRLILYACALQLYQGMQYVDRAGKQNFIKYAYGDYLDNLASFKGIERSSGTAATTILEFTLAEAQTSAVTISMGARVTAGDGVYFYTDEVVEIAIDELSVTVSATCTETGTTGNGYAVGSLNTLVNTIAYIDAVKNTTVTEGGTDEEDDDSLKERVYLAPSSYSVAGPADAYEYWVKTISQDAIDVKVTRPSDGVVDVRFILDGGETPGESLISTVEESLQDNSIRPLTDSVQVSAPDIVNYQVELTYYINSSDKNSAITIQDAVETAVDDYTRWQKLKIGRDINPSVLIQKVISAGAKRVEIVSPVYTAIPETSIAVLEEGQRTVNYGELEDD